MKSSILSAKHFHDEAAAYAFVEALLWPDGPVCPHCACTERIGAMRGKSTRIGTYKCYDCRKPFTVKVGTIFESSHVPMRVWVQAIFLMAGSKKGISSNQLHRTLGVTLKTAWFMSHRIRHAMGLGEETPPPLGGDGGIVEVDETYIGRRKGVPVRQGGDHKMAVISMVDRQSGEVRSKHIRHTWNEVLIPEVQGKVAPDTRVFTDDYASYKQLWKHFLEHDVVTHSRGEYVRGDVHTNTIEGFFSIFKRGMRGVYQHCGERHLKRYLAEFDFRYTHRVRNGVDDERRAEKALRGVVGKRLTYRTATWTPGG
jgi:transposase-like protein